MDLLKQEMAKQNQRPKKKIIKDAPKRKLQKVEVTDEERDQYKGMNDIEIQMEKNRVQLKEDANKRHNEIFGMPDDVEE